MVWLEMTFNDPFFEELKRNIDGDNPFPSYSISGFLEQIASYRDMKGLQHGRQIRFTFFIHSPALSTSSQLFWKLSCLLFCCFKTTLSWTNIYDACFCGKSFILFTDLNQIHVSFIFSRTCSLCSLKPIKNSFFLLFLKIDLDLPF